jgi:dUTP pyrophosphatase
MTPLKYGSTEFQNGPRMFPLPAYATEGSAGMDIYAAVDGEMVVKAGETTLVPTGFSMEIPIGYEAQIRPRSGLALKSSIGLMNSPGTIDSDYRGEVKIVFTNFGKNDFVVKRGDRIAQMVVATYQRVQWEETSQLSETVRGSGGFGHTGISQQ